MKNAFNEYSKVRCALGMQRECCDPFLHSVCFTLFMCHFARLRMPVYEETRWWEVRHELNGANQLESIYQIVECSFNVLRRGRRSLTGQFSWRHDLLLHQGGDDVLHTGESEIIGVFVYFSIFCDFRPLRASQNQSFCFLFLDHTNCHFSCLVILYRKQACWTHIWHDLSGSESGVFA